MGERFAQAIAARLARAVRRTAPAPSIIQRQHVPRSPVVLQQRWLFAPRLSIALHGQQSSADSRPTAAADPAPTLVRMPWAERQPLLTQTWSQRWVLRDI